MEQSRKEFEKIVKEHERALFSICFMYSQNKEDAEDLLQDTLVNIWNGMARFRGDSSVKTWVTRVAINTCISFKRKKTARTKDVDYLPPVAGLSTEAGQQVKFLYNRLQKLDYLDRAVVMLWLENMSYEEIGAIVGISVKNVGVRLVRIKDKLKTMNDE